MDLFGIRFDWNRSNNRSKWFRCDFWSIICMSCVSYDAQIASLATIVGSVTSHALLLRLLVVDFFCLFLSSGKHPVDLFNCSIDWYTPISVETMDEPRFDAFNLYSLHLALCRLLVDALHFFDDAGDGVVSKRVIPSSNTCVLMSSLSGSSLNIQIHV